VGTWWATRPTCWCSWYTFRARLLSSGYIDTIIVDHSVKVGASHTPSQALLPLTSRSPRTHRWVPSHSPTVSCAYRAAGWRQPLPTCSPSMPSSARAAAPACRRAAALEVRFRAAAGVGEEAHSRQPHWCPWSKPMNVETCGHVADLIVMAHAFAELRDGVVARQHENGFQMWAQFRSNPVEGEATRGPQSTDRTPGFRFHGLAST